MARNDEAKTHGSRRELEALPVSQCLLDADKRTVLQTRNHYMKIQTVSLAIAVNLALACAVFAQIPVPRILQPEIPQAPMPGVPDVPLSVTQASMVSAIAPATPSAKCSWLKATDTRVTGYRVFWGNKSGIYTNSVDVGTNISVIIMNLVAGSTNYFAAVAYTANTNETSTFSTESVLVFPIPPQPVQPPQNFLVEFQMQASTDATTGFRNLAGARVSITNAYDPLIAGWYYKTLITAVPIP
jgi:hypothetical protein